MYCIFEVKEDTLLDINVWSEVGADAEMLIEEADLASLDRGRLVNSMYAINSALPTRSSATVRRQA